jgi:uncharacterized protein with PIN domain
MLQRLCRWLRAAGYDTALAELAAADRDVMQQAVAEQRLLLTRDREFLERREADTHVFFFDSADLDAQAAELRRALGIDWLHRPFSRCLLCNTPLKLAPPDEAPPDVQGTVLHCPCCDKLYWEGAHVRRMRARLQAWALR